MKDLEELAEKAKESKGERPKLLQLMEEYMNSNNPLTLLDSGGKLFFLVGE